jgi:hypothetical protein
MATKEGTWLPILEYSQFKKISISTIRRHIKANLLKWRAEGGKYYIWTSADAQDLSGRLDAQLLAVKLELQMVRQENRSLREELDEARMLINLYETSQAEVSLT